MSEREGEAAPATAVPVPGTVLAGKYCVEGVLGTGGMGYVLAATHMHLDERVAMKFLHADVTKDPNVVKRFLREAKAAIKIRSEHVVRVLDVGTLEDGVPYMVMEHLQGKDLELTLETNGPMPVQVCVDYVLQACEALAEAHVQGLVHRDLKPANLFVTKRADGSPLVKVLDFGISKITGPKGAELGLTKTSSLMGTPRYMAPEQMRAARSVDARADIWALGVNMYELLTGRQPFVGETLTEVCVSVIEDSPPPIAQLRPEVPRGLDAAVQRCLEKDPSKRFQSVAELAGALAEFASVAGHPSVARVKGVMVANAGTVRPPAPSDPGEVSGPLPPSDPVGIVAAAGSDPASARGAVAAADPVATGGALVASDAGGARLAWGDARSRRVVVMLAVGLVALIAILLALIPFRQEPPARDASAGNAQTSNDAGAGVVAAPAASAASPAGTLTLVPLLAKDEPSPSAPAAASEAAGAVTAARSAPPTRASVSPSKPSNKAPAATAGLFDGRK
jgi:serine/threonine-protein kinase